MLNVAIGVVLIALILYLQISRGMYRTVKPPADEGGIEGDLRLDERALESDLQNWKAEFRDELRAHLAELTQDQDLFGFAVEPSADLGNLHFITCVGRESTLEDRDSLTERFSHVEWRGFLPQRNFAKSLESLEAIGKKYHDLLIDLITSEETAAGKRFRERWYSELLKVMLESNRRGDFGKIWFKIISFSDFYHSIQVRSLLRLNCNFAFVMRCFRMVTKSLVFVAGKIIQATARRLKRLLGRKKTR